MDQSHPTPGSAGVIRIATFRVPADDALIHAQLRSLGDRARGRCRWVGRRLLDDPAGAEVTAVSVWRDRPEMEGEIEIGQRGLSRELRAAMADMTTELYECRAYGAWTRPLDPSLIRVLRGALVQGDAESFDAATAAAYVSLFEANSRCASVAAGVGEAGIVLATLWTNWDAVVSATGGDLRQVLPVTLPGWSVMGSAVHYELVAAEAR